MDSFFAEYGRDSLIRGGLVLFSTAKVVDVIDELEAKGVRILGVDGFIIGDKTTQPCLEHSVDLSDATSAWASAREFIMARAGLNLYYEITT